MIDVMMKLAWVLIALAVATSQQVSGDQALEMLESVCADKQVDLSRGSQLKELVGVLDEAKNCSERANLALVELNRLINSESTDVCSASKVDQIRAFYKQFVDRKLLKRMGQAKLPTALGDLYLSYGFSVSRLCKKQMITILMSDTDNLITQHDFDLVARWISDDSPVGKLIKRPKDLDDLILPKEIRRILQRNKAKQEEETSAVALDLPAVETSRRVQAICERRFGPIYRQLILPLVSLSRVGFNFKGEEMQAQRKELKSNKQVHLWYRIVFLCESVSKVEFLVDPEISYCGEGKKMARVLSNEEEANELRAKQPPTDELYLADLGDQINYKPSVQHQLEDLIVDRKDTRLLKLVASFDDHKSESRRIRIKATRKIFAMMTGFLKSSTVGFFMGLFKKGHVSTINDELARSIETTQLSEDGHELDDSQAISTATRGLKREKRSMVVAIVAVVILGLFCAAVASHPLWTPALEMWWQNRH